MLGVCECPRSHASSGVGSYYVGLDGLHILVVLLSLAMCKPASSLFLGKSWPDQGW